MHGPDGELGDARRVRKGCIHLHQHRRASDCCTQCCSVLWFPAQAPARDQLLQRGPAKDRTAGLQRLHWRQTHRCYDHPSYATIPGIRTHGVPVSCLRMSVQARRCMLGCLQDCTTHCHHLTIARYGTIHAAGSAHACLTAAQNCGQDDSACVQQLVSLSGVYCATFCGHACLQVGGALAASSAGSWQQHSSTCSLSSSRCQPEPCHASSGTTAAGASGSSDSSRSACMC